MTDKTFPYGAIYKIYTQINDFYYIGSTNTPLSVRLKRHKLNPPSKKTKEWFEDVGVDNLIIIAMVEHKDITKKALKRFEDDEVKSHLGQEFCLNRNRIYTTLEEKREREKKWRESNKEQITDKSKQHYESNKEQILKQHRKYRENNRELMLRLYRTRNDANKEQTKQKITCPICNCEVRKVDFPRHEKTQKHKLNLQETKSI